MATRSVLFSARIIALFFSYVWSDLELKFVEMDESPNYLHSSYLRFDLSS